MLAVRRVLVVGVASMALVLASCGGDDGGSADDFCDLASDADKANDDFDNMFNSGIPDSGEIKSAYQEYIDRIEDATKKAPKEGKDALEESVRLAKETQDLLEEHDYDIQEAFSDDDFSDLSSDLEDNLSDVSEVLSDECGIDLNDTTDGDTDAETDDTAGDSLTIPGGGDIDDAKVQALQTIFPKLSDEQASCLIEGGLELADVADQGKLGPLLDACNVNITDLQPD